ncbi:putative serine/threonine-protein kinase, partial [Trifolium medium]|nr:putative serine/threonine-protein kinase [Trifolium medium]
MLDKKAGESNDDNTMPLLNNIREVECNSSAARFAECLA